VDSFHKYESYKHIYGLRMLLKNVPDVFGQDEWIKDYASKNKQIILQNINQQLNTFFFVDLSVLPTKPVNYREIFVKWLIVVNKQRLQRGEEILCNYEIVKLCPLWSVFPMPFKRGTLESISSQIGKQPTKTVASIGPKATVRKHKIVKNFSQ
jgi:hypothetical protein